MDAKIRRLLKNCNPEPRYYEDLAFLFESLKNRREIGPTRLAVIQQIIRENVSDLL
jgi:hypothetical protein